MLYEWHQSPLAPIKWRGGIAYSVYDLEKFGRLLV